MNKYAKILFTTLILMIWAPLSFSQDTSITLKIDTIKTPHKRVIKIIKLRTLPKFILHFNAGYNSGAMELTSHNGGYSREDFISGKNFGARHGYGFNLIGKLPLGKKGNFWLDIVTGFDRFQSNLFASNTEEGKVDYNSFNGGVGIEYNFTPMDRVKYFVGFNPLLSFISGKSQLINPDNNVVDIKIKSSTRLGYQVFIGLEYAFEKNFGMNFGLRFTHANLLLKNSEQPVEDLNETSPSATVGLNDDATDLENPIQFAGWKQFAYFTGSFGVSYFFGVKEKRYKLP